MMVQREANKTQPHVPVLLQEVEKQAHLRPGNIIIDGTLGFSGHASVLIPHIMPRGRYIGIDKDERAVAFSKRHLAAYGPAAQCIVGRMSEIAQITTDHGVHSADLVLFDLGVSSAQLDDPMYGISFASTGDLDMRIGEGSGNVRASDIVNHWSARGLKDLFTAHGQTAVNRLVERIVETREQKPIRTIEQLLTIIADVVPRVRGVHPATGVFQALRVVVNQEEAELQRGLEQAVTLLTKGGRLLVISFHSGEDRVVKEFLRKEARDCICPPEYPICICGHRARVRIMTTKPIVPNAEEVRQNPRARSARMRVAVRI